MHNQYSPWGELTSLPQIELRRESPRAGRLGEYVKHGGRHGGGLIRLEPSMPRRQARSVLCHELRHHEFGDVGSECGKTIARQEARADATAARLLVNIYDLADAMVIHARHPSAVAVELRVSLDVVWTRIDRLHPAERAYLKRRCAEWSV